VQDTEGGGGHDGKEATTGTLGTGNPPDRKTGGTKRSRKCRNWEKNRRKKRGRGGKKKVTALPTSLPGKIPFGPLNHTRQGVEKRWMGGKKPHIEKRKDFEKGESRETGSTRELCRQKKKNWWGARPSFAGGKP